MPKEEVKKYISISDVGLVNLKKSDTFKNVIPSKIFELVGMHKPILLGVEGESKEIIESYNVGLAFEPENIDDFIDKIQQLYKGDFDYITGFENLIKDFNREHLADKMFEFIIK